MHVTVKQASVGHKFENKTVRYYYVRIRCFQCVYILGVYILLVAKKEVAKRNCAGASTTDATDRQSLAAMCAGEKSHLFCGFFLNFSLFGTGVVYTLTSATSMRYSPLLVYLHINFTSLLLACVAISQPRVCYLSCGRLVLAVVTWLVVAFA